jgi:hypothetical protein
MQRGILGSGGAAVVCGGFLYRCEKIYKSIYLDQQENHGRRYPLEAAFSKL